MSTGTAEHNGVWMGNRETALAAWRQHCAPAPALPRVAAGPESRSDRNCSLGSRNRTGPCGVMGPIPIKRPDPGRATSKDLQ